MNISLALSPGSQERSIIGHTPNLDILNFLRYWLKLKVQLLLSITDTWQTYLNKNSRFSISYEMMICSSSRQDNPHSIQYSEQFVPNQHVSCITGKLCAITINTSLIQTIHFTIFGALPALIFHTGCDFISLCVLVKQCVKKQ